MAFATVGEEGGEAMKPQWMAQLIDLAGLWLKNLPKELTRMKRTVENIKDPLFRFFEREVRSKDYGILVVWTTVSGYGMR